MPPPSAASRSTSSDSPQWCRRRLQGLRRGRLIGFLADWASQTGSAVTPAVASANALSVGICTPSMTESEILEVKRRMARRASSLPGIT